MTTQCILLCLICLFVYSYEEIVKKRWFGAVFFLGASLVSYFAQSEFWMDVTPLLFFFSVSRLIFYSFPVTKRWPLNLSLASALFFILLKLWHYPLPSGFSTFQLDLFSLGFLVLSILFSTVGLIVYYKFRKFELSLIPIPPIQKKYVTSMIVVGSIINSFREEIPFRWLLLLPLAAYTDPVTAVLIQAIIFGVMHFHDGFTTGSIWLAISVHAVVDMILLMIVVKKYIPDTYFKAD
jgi:membrane protease YdiL (CAAX protease family)